MITLFLVLFIIMIMFGVGFKVTGALLSALIWLFIKLPLALMAMVFGLVCCCTLILIPVGIGCFKAGGRLMMPGCMA